MLILCCAHQSADEKYSKHFSGEQLIISRNSKSRSKREQGQLFFKSEGGGISLLLSRSKGELTSTRAALDCSNEQAALLADVTLYFSSRRASYFTDALQ